MFTDSKAFHRLRDETPDGYNLAAIVPVDYDCETEDYAKLDWVPCLKECKGTLGILRNWHLTRRQGIMHSLWASNQWHKMLHLVWVPQGGAVLYVDKFKLERSNEWRP